MSRFVFLDTGEELSDTTLAALRSAPPPVRLRLCEPARPFRNGQVVHLSRAGNGTGRPGDVLLCRVGGEFRLCARCAAPPAGEILGRVIALQSGTTTVSVERGLLARMPAGWRPRAVTALEALTRFRHPLTPPLFQGSAEASLARVREKYDSPPEVRQYARRAEAGAERFELELVVRHVKPGGRLLDIGCGGGREALGFASAGFRVVAIDIASGMVEAARESATREGLAIEFRVLSATELADPAGSYDGAFFSGSLQHIPGRALRVETLRRIARGLTPDGVLILSVAYRGERGLCSRSRLVDLLRTAGWRFGRTWQLSEPGDRYMREVSEASDPRELCFFHDFSRPEEVRAELEDAGVSGEEVRPGWWVCRRSVRLMRSP